MFDVKLDPVKADVMAPGGTVHEYVNPVVVPVIFGESTTVGMLAQSKVNCGEGPIGGGVTSIPTT